MIFDEVKNAEGAVDCPDEKDYMASHIFGDPDIELPVSVDLNNVPSQMQGKTMHCTAFGITHCLEIMNTIEHQMVALADASEQWANQLYRRGNPPNAEKEGDSLQNALETLREKGLNNKTPAIPIEKFLITGYAKIGNTVDEIKKWLARGFPIFTGAARHAFCLTGYHDGIQSFKAKNSLKNDPFDVGYEEVSKLFSKYILYDKKDVNMIFKDVTENSPFAAEIKFCLDKGLLNGYGNAELAEDRVFMPEKPVTRAEMAAVIARLYNSLTTK